MKTKIVPSSDISPEKGLRAQDYISDLYDVPETAWGGLEQIAEACYKTAKSKGWWVKYEQLKEHFPNLYTGLMPDFIAAKLCLVHSETSEALEEVRENDGDLYFTAGPEVEGGPRRIVPEGEWNQWNLGHLKPEGLPSELADVVIRVFDLAGFLGIDIAQVIREKMAYNQNRPHLHGGKKL